MRQAADERLPRLPRIRSSGSSLSGASSKVPVGGVPRYERFGRAAVQCPRLAGSWCFGGFAVQQMPFCRASAFALGCILVHPSRPWAPQHVSSSLLAGCITCRSSGQSTASRVCASSLRSCRRCLPLTVNVRRHDHRRTSHRSAERLPGYEGRAHARHGSGLKGCAPSSERCSRRARLTPGSASPRAQSISTRSASSQLLSKGRCHRW